MPLLLAVVALSLGLYGLLLQHYALLPLLPHYRSSIGSVDQNWATSTLWLAFVGTLLYAAYGIGIRVCWRILPTRRAFLVVWVGGVLAAVLLAFVYPVTSTDIFDYLFRGRLAAAYGGNPYVDLPNQYQADPLFSTLGWPNAPSAYGPLWELMSRSMAALAGASLLGNVALHKVLAVATYLACGATIYAMTKQAGRRAQLIGSFLWLWSPLTLWEIMAAGHNDGLLLLSVLLAVWAAERQSFRWAVLALTAGTLFKFLPIILLPLVVVYGMRRQRSWQKRIRLGVEAVLIFAVCTLLAYAPYWTGLRTLDNIRVREGFVTSAPLAVVSYWLRDVAPLALINRLLLVFHLPHPANGDDVIAAISRTATGFLFLGLLWQLFHVWRHWRPIWLAFFGLLLWYLVLGSQWFQPWYVLWLLGLIALRPEGRAVATITVWSLAGQSSYLLQYLLQPQLETRYGERWGGQGVRIQALYCLIIFLPPLVAGTWMLWAGRGSRKQPTGRVAARQARVYPLVRSSWEVDG
ncbi:MAG: polyprenol phosphomannose-dependent alpha 1,6 mannosyltransferase MptB [Herpetosiphon sp.]